MNDSQELIDFLVRVPLFRGLSKRQIKDLSGRFVTRKFRQNEAIVSQGEGGIGMFIMVSGHAEAVHERGDGSRAVVNKFGPTDFFGELALLDEGFRTASVVATEDSECLVLTQWDFISVMKRDADMGVAVAQELAKRLRMMMGSM